MEQKNLTKTDKTSTTNKNKEISFISKSSDKNEKNKVSSKNNYYKKEYNSNKNNYKNNRTKSYKGKYSIKNYKKEKYCSICKCNEHGTYECMFNPRNPKKYFTIYQETIKKTAI